MTFQSTLWKCIFKYLQNGTRFCSVSVCFVCYLLLPWAIMFDSFKLWVETYVLQYALYRCVVRYEIVSKCDSTHIFGHHTVFHVTHRVAFEHATFRNNTCLYYKLYHRSLYIFCGQSCCEIIWYISFNGWVAMKLTNTPLNSATPLHPIAVREFPLRILRQFYFHNMVCYTV